MSSETRLRKFHAARWDEPVVMELGHPGRRGQIFPEADPAIRKAVGEAAKLIPAGLARKTPPEAAGALGTGGAAPLPASVAGDAGHDGHQPLRHLHDEIQPRLSEAIAQRPELAEVHPNQPEESLQGILEIIHSFDLILRELSGMDQFIFQAGGGADAAYTHCCITRAYHQAKGQLAERDEIITSIQAHPCNAATAAAAGFKVVTLQLEENGYPSLAALEAAVSNRTAALLINNPDDMGIYNPDIKEWIRVVHEAGGLCFYDHANFNGVMGKLRARELGFDACMFMLHKTFGGAQGRRRAGRRRLWLQPRAGPLPPAPVVVAKDGRYRLDHDRPQSTGKIREYWGNVPQVLKAYAWARAMGAEGINEASDLSVLANNYMDEKLGPHPRSHPLQPPEQILAHGDDALGPGQAQGGDGGGTADVANRMADYGIDPYWMSHEPWVVPEPFTPEAGEMYSKEDLDEWIGVIAAIVDEAYAKSGKGEERASRPADPSDQKRAAGGSQGLGHDLAGLPAQAWQWKSRWLSRRHGQGQAACGGLAQAAAAHPGHRGGLCL
jgi:Glycine cleavage system protein P (pyridoxal-binding), C-terminal domain